jgi:hypothetical protein
MDSPREKAVLSFKDIGTLRKMMVAISGDLKDYNRSKGYGTEREIKQIKDRLTSMRQHQRDRSGDPYNVTRNFATKAEGQIKGHLQDLCTKRKFKETVIVGGRETGTCEYKPPFNKYSQGTVTFCVGHMWHKNVWDKIYKDGRLVQKDYIILSAVEYKTNVPHVRLYEATAYGVTEKAQVNGWIGQSKLGKQMCSFRTDKLAAIQAAQRLTVGSVNQQLQGETSNDN